MLTRQYTYYTVKFFITEAIMDEEACVISSPKLVYDPLKEQHEEQSNVIPHLPPYNPTYIECEKGGNDMNKCPYIPFGVHDFGIPIIRIRKSMYTFMWGANEAIVAIGNVKIFNGNLTIKNDNSVLDKCPIISKTRIAIPNPIVRWHPKQKNWKPKNLNVINMVLNNDDECIGNINIWVKIETVNLRMYYTTLDEGVNDPINAKQSFMQSIDKIIENEYSGALLSDISISSISPDKPAIVNVKLLKVIQHSDSSYEIVNEPKDACYSFVDKGVMILDSSDKLTIHDIIKELLSL